jgi:hypothetical protein
MKTSLLTSTLVLVCASVLTLGTAAAQTTTGWRVRARGAPRMKSDGST